MREKKRAAPGMHRACNHRWEGFGKPRMMIFWALLDICLVLTQSSIAAVALVATSTAPQTIVHHRTPLSTTPTSSATSFLQGSIAFWLVSASSSSPNDAIVTRVQDDGTIQLRYVADGHRESLRKLANIRFFTPSQFPPCLTMTPAGKLQQLLPPTTRVHVERTAAAATVLTRTSDNVVVNERLVQLGYAKVVTSGSTLSASDEDSREDDKATSLRSLQQQAQAEHRGVHQTCTETFQATFDDYLAFDSPVRKPTIEKKPSNPGDRVGCSDFDYYEDALRYYDRYAPYYGDVARLDRNGDGVPCPGLPHTPNQVLYRLKRPNVVTTGDRSVQQAKK